jgi:HK97 family phage portal protein
MSIRTKIGRFVFGKAFAQSSIIGNLTNILGWNPADDPEKLIKKIRGWSYTCITKNAQACAQVPLRLYQVKGTSSGSKRKTANVELSRRKFLHTKLAERISGSDQIEEVTDHPILDLLRQVNPEQNAFELKEILVRYLEAIGVSYWHLERGMGDDVINIWPLMSQYVTVVPKTTNGIAFYLYGMGTNKIKLKTEDVIKFRYTSLTDLFVGDSPLKAGEQSVDLNEAMNIYEISSFKNGGNPNLVLEVPTDGYIDEQEKKRIESDFKRKFGGAKNTGKLAITSGGAILKEFGFKPKDMSFIAGRKTTLEETCGVFGVPLSFVVPTEISRDNLRSSIDLWMKTTITPKLTMIEQKLNEQFTPNWGDNLFLLFDDPMPKDAEFRLKEIESHINTKYSSINQEREIDGLDPVPWGEAPVEPPEIEVEPFDPEKAIEVVVKREGQTNDLPEPDFMPRIFTITMIETFKRMEADIIKGLNGYGKTKAITDDPSDAAWAGSVDDVVSSVYNEAKWAAIISDDAMPFVSGLLKMGIVEAAEKLDPELLINTSSPRVLEALETRSQQIKSVATTTEKQLRATITESIGQGDSRGKTIAMVRDKFDSRAKADMVVRTETIWAHNEGTMIAWEQSGVVQGVKWDTVPDDRRCPYCASMHNKQMNMGGQFFDKGESLTVKDPDSGNDITLKFGYEPIKHPPLHPNCRCQLIPIISD